MSPIGISAVNINWTIIHSALGITTQGKNFKNVATSIRYIYRNELSGVKLIIIDEILMVSSDLLYQIHTRLVEIFDCGPDQPFVRTSVSIC